MSSLDAHIWENKEHLHRAALANHGFYVSTQLVRFNFTSDDIKTLMETYYPDFIYNVNAGYSSLFIKGYPRYTLPPRTMTHSEVQTSV